MVELKVSKIGDSLGIVLPKEVVNRLHTAEGQSLFLVEAPEGGYLMTLTDPSFGQKMSTADGIITKRPQA
jgi:antitoxin component of MazEF toxin-antitoxin module